MEQQEEKPKRVKKTPVKLTSGETAVFMAPEVIPAKEAAPVVQQASQAIATTPDKLLSIAIEKGASIEVLERLSNLMVEWMNRKAKSEYLQAKTDFQAEVPVLQKNKNVNFPTKGKTGEEDGRPVNYNYTPLGTIAELIKPVQRKFGLSYDWKIEDIKDEKGTPKIKVTCNVSHVGGHSESTTMEAYHDGTGKKNDIQSRGSTVSYLQRYTLIGALGLTTADADNDGNKSQRQSREEEPAPKTKAEVKKQATPDKPEMSTDQFNAAFKRITKGEDLIDECKRTFTLSEKQKQGLESADDIRKTKAMSK